jgi:TPR repeat protein
MKKHLIQAAERGDAAAQFNLAVMCENGLVDSRYVIEGDRPEAERWLLAAAEQGLARAQVKLADICAAEPDKAGSSVKACGWYLLASTSLHGAQLQKAQAGYQRASLHLTPDQITAAKDFAQSWTPTRPLRAEISEPQAK